MSNPTSVAAVDPARVDAFAEQMVAHLNGAAVTLMTSIGHRTGLFDVMAELPPSTSDEIAAAAKLDERYVREWLAALVTGGVVEYEAESARYLLPPAHAAVLTRKASPDNLAVVAQYVPLLGSVEDRIVECFENGGGVPYEAFGRFHQVMAEDSGQTVVAALFEHILPLVADLEARLDAGLDVLDVGCGSGHALNALAQRFPNSRFTGYDLSPEAIARGRATARAMGNDNLRFETRDATHLEDDGRFDLVTAFDAIHDQARPDLVLRGIADALRPGGTFLMQDIRASSHLERNLDHPIAPLLYTISCMHCMTVSLAQCGHGLGTMWGEELALDMLGDAGFFGVDVHVLPHDIQNSYYVARAG